MRILNFIYAVLLKSIPQITERPLYASPFWYL